MKETEFSGGGPGVYVAVGIIALIIVIVVVIVVLSMGEKSDTAPAVVIVPTGGSSQTACVPDTSSFKRTTTPVTAADTWTSAWSKLIGTPTVTVYEKTCGSSEDVKAYTQLAGQSAVYGRLGNPGMDAGSHKYLGKFDTADACASVCTKTTGCNGFSYHKGYPGMWQGTCYTIDGSSAPRAADANVDTYYK